MVGITKCHGKDCDMKESCYRYTSGTDHLMQSWAPFDVYREKVGYCLMFMQNQGRRAEDAVG